jgi:hypothetical protein
MASRTWRHCSSPKHSSGVPFENVSAEESTGKSQERLMDIDPLLVTHTQSTKLVQPSESSLYLRLASIGMMWRARRPCRIASRHNHGPNAQSRRWRGRLRSPCNGGMESTSDRACCESTVAVAFRHSVVGNEWRSGCLLIKRRHAHTFHALASFPQVKSTAANHARKQDQTR